jgi:hypothetical protein
MPRGTGADSCPPMIHTIEEQMRTSARAPVRSPRLAGRLRAKSFRRAGAPGEIRTPDLLVRSQALYPTELRARRFDKKVGRRDRFPNKIIVLRTGTKFRGASYHIVQATTRLAAAQPYFYLRLPQACGGAVVAAASSSRRRRRARSAGAFITCPSCSIHTRRSARRSPT